MFVIEEGNIHITRGDVATITVSAKEGRNKKHIFEAGDMIRFKVTDKNNCNSVKLVKDVNVPEDTTEVNIDLSMEDTKLDDIISKVKEYWYEIELNPETEPQTIMGYDQEGAKRFILYPEGSDINE